MVMSKKMYVLAFLFFVAFQLQAQSADQPAKPVLNHTAIYVTNLQASTDFYHSVIGLEIVPEPFKDGKHTWLGAGPGVTVHIIEGSPAKKEYYKNQHTCFSVPSVEAFAENLRKKNIAFEDLHGKKMVFSSRVDGVHQLWLQDPDGYWVEINDDKQ